MFKLTNLKTNIYCTLNFNEKNINLVEKYNVFHLLLKKKLHVHLGNGTFQDTSVKLIFLNKPFFFFTITKIPKPYPFKVIKN